MQAGGVLAPFGLALKAEAAVPEIAKDECRAGLERLYGPDIVQANAQKRILLRVDSAMPPEGYGLKADSDGLTVTGADSSGVLYGVFALLLRLGQGEALEGIRGESAPAVGHRCINHWDNADGTVERGYAGNSIFFKNGGLDYDEARIKAYARLLCSVGINVVSINNVNVTPATSRLITEGLLPKAAALAGIFRPYGIRLALAVQFDSPAVLGGLPTSDPLDAGAQAWWRAQADIVYRHIPDLSGFIVKADSEFQGGPNSHGRTQAEGANALARALAPHGGVVYWRCFIYDCLQDWRDLKTDRPKAAYDTFKALDGHFGPNVILQIKNGPSDFQVREPNSPLLGAMEQTKQALELQITQEYTGQQKDLYNLAVQWEEILAGPVGSGKELRDLLGGKLAAIAAVANVGDDANWTGHTLAQLNLFAYGRLAWDPALTAEEITGEWVRLTFGTAPALTGPLKDMLLRSRGTYEKYVSPLGLGWMVNVGGHYGPSPEGYEFMKWGTYHRADTKAIGVDRTETGTGFTMQYPPEIAKIYNSVKACPENLLLYFHRLPYDFRLKDGRTLLQYIYDSHFEGV
jgi:alpha-glucuronidase